jgi:hypothetical protein
MIKCVSRRHTSARTELPVVILDQQSCNDKEDKAPFVLAGTVTDVHRDVVSNPNVRILFLEVDGTVRPPCKVEPVDFEESDGLGRTAVNPPIRRCRDDAAFGCLIRPSRSIERRARWQ